MIYGDKVRYARDKLKLSRMNFAVLLGMTERSIANIENCKDESKKLGFDKMQKVIEAAELPKGWFFFDDDEVNIYLINNAELFVRGEGTVTDEEALAISDIAERLKLK